MPLKTEPAALWWRESTEKIRLSSKLSYLLHVQLLPISTMLPKPTGGIVDENVFPLQAPKHAMIKRFFCLDRPVPPSKALK